jgi:hypothetical protein
MRCRACGDVIGVYEPLIALVDGVARESTRAEMIARKGKLPDCFHRGCLESREKAQKGLPE